MTVMVVSVCSEQCRVGCREDLPAGDEECAILNLHDCRLLEK